MERDNFSSRIGFILVSAGCAIGLGNVWRFPFITGEYGGGAFVLLYLVFLLFMGLPVLVAELAVGRASQRSIAMSFDALEPKGTKWHLHKYTGIVGNIMLMMFYTTISGWMLYYLYKMASGAFHAKNAEVSAIFVRLIEDPITMGCSTLLIILIGGGICYMGVKKGVERITKWMMLILLSLMLILAVNSMSLPNASAGLSYYLVPDFERLMEKGLSEAVFAAMGQAFFTLSIGIGSIAIFGSYIDKSKRLTGEAIWIIILDTFVALTAGLIIFPACFSYNVPANSGPGLLFVTLPHVFSEMPGGILWGTLFFLFMTFAALSTVVAVFENIIAALTELLNANRKKIIVAGIPVMFLLSLPCVLGFNVLGDFHPMGGETIILDLEDFIVSNNLLPLGSLVYLLFCVSRYGWGFDNFVKEVDTGVGIKFPKALKFYLTYILPVILLVVFVNGYYAIFFK
ncbi:MAG: sodium-dependent transporter [Selenomonadaceae bacterium]|nr:sodium-dependent transporter [Selenomonadaceae bacterium]